MIFYTIYCIKLNTIMSNCKCTTMSTFDVTQSLTAHKMTFVSAHEMPCLIITKRHSSLKVTSMVEKLHPFGQ